MPKLEPIPYAVEGEKAWYLREQQTTRGPFTIEELNEMTDRGLVAPSAHVFKSRFPSLQGVWYDLKDGAVEIGDVLLLLLKTIGIIVLVACAARGAVAFVFGQ